MVAEGLQSELSEPSVDRWKYDSGVFGERIVVGVVERLTEDDAIARGVTRRRPFDEPLRLLVSREAQIVLAHVSWEGQLMKVHALWPRDHAFRVYEHADARTKSGGRPERTRPRSEPE